MKSRFRLLVIVPCYNEAASIEGLLTELGRELPDADVLVVNDGSLDDTSARAAAMGAHVIDLPVNLGIGGAVQTGIRFAARAGYDLCVQIDGDGQHPPGEVRNLIAVQRQSAANIAVGSRFLEGNGFQSSFVRRLGIHAIVACLRILFDVKVTDPTSGIRLFDHAAIRLFAVRYPYDFPEPVSLAIAAKSGLSIVEAPVLMRERTGGTSSIAGLKPIAYMIRVLGSLVFLRLERGNR